MGVAVHYVLTPQSAPELCVCYLIWITLFVTMNIVWDIRSTRTGKFEFLDIGAKSALLHPAASLCSCVLVIASLVDRSIHELSEESAVPLILSSLSGIFQSITAICPYRLPNGTTTLDASPER